MNMKKMIVEEKKDKVQTSSCGIDWTSVVKSFLVSLNATTCDKNEILELIQVIIKGETEFKNYSPIHDTFYSCLCSLAAHFIAANASVLSYENINLVKEGCRILMRQLLQRLDEQSKLTGEENAPPNLSIKQMLLPLTALCGAEGGGLPQSEIAVLTSMIKSAELPVADKLGQPQTLTTISSGSSISSQEKKPSSDVSQRRNEPLIEQLTAPLLLTQGAIWSSSSKGLLGAAKDSAEVLQMSQTIPDGQRVKKMLNTACSQLLVSLRGSSVLLQLCYTMPCLQRYLGRWHMCTKSQIAPTFNADSSLLSFLVSEIKVSQVALSLPIYEPLTEDKVGLMSDLCASWLLCAITQASLHPKDEDNEHHAATLVEGALSFFNMVGDFFKNSTRAGGFVYQNHLMIGGWILLCGLHHTLAGVPGVPTPGPQLSVSAQGRSPAKTLSRPYNLNKIQQGGIGAVWVALGSRCLRVCGAILREARLEVTGGFVQVPTQGQCINSSPLDVLYAGTAGERAMTLLECAPLHQLFVTLGVVCYRKATTLKRAVAQKQYQADPDADQSDSTIYYQDMILCSEDSETDDEDSEPLLGLWFESTLVAPDSNDTNVNNANNAAVSGNEATEILDNDNNRGVDHHTVVPDKAEPNAYISIASEVFEILCEDVASVIDGIPGVETIPTYLSSASLQLQDAQAALLAALIRDLDRETARTDTGTISSCFGARLGVLYGAFSASLGRYLHTLSTSTAMQNMLLQHLGVGALPGDKSLDKPGTSPLQLGVRVLKLIGSIVLSKPPMERENAILGIWSRIINTITECALQWSPPADHDFEDLNVEHAQLLLYMFHSLNLMSKKVVLLLTANAVCKVSDSLCFSDRGRTSQLPPHQLMLTTRILLFLEYFMRHLYDAPTSLMQQIEWNLLVAPGLSQPWSTDLATVLTLTGGTAPESTQGTALVPAQPASSQWAPPTRIYCAVPEIEKDYKRMVTDDLSMRPKFYALTNIDNGPTEMAKLDGLACNFVLGTDKLRYTALMDALLSLLNTVIVCDANAAASPQQLCASRYCFQTAWRLVSTMPPPKPFMERAAMGRMATLPCPLPLHTALWGPRSNNTRPYYHWLKDILTKQGVFTSIAENLLKEVSDVCDNIAYCDWLSYEVINQLMDHIRPGSLPSLLDIISVDCILSRLRSLLSERPPPPPFPPPFPATTTTTTPSSQPAAATTTPAASGGSQARPGLPLPGDDTISTQFLLALLSLTEIVFKCCRVSALSELGSEVESCSGPLLEARLRLCAGENAGTRSITRALTGTAVAQLEQALRSQLPQRAQNALDAIGSPLCDELIPDKAQASSRRVTAATIRRRGAIRRRGQAPPDDRHAAVRRLFGNGVPTVPAAVTDDSRDDATEESLEENSPEGENAVEPQNQKNDSEKSSLPASHVPSDQAILICVARHEAALGTGSAAQSLRMLAHTAVTTLKLAAPIIVQQLGGEMLRTRAMGILVPALLDARLECVAEPCAAAINILQTSTKATEQLIHDTVFRITYPVLVDQLSPSTEKILSPMISYWQAAIERPAGKSAMAELFGMNTELPLTEILLSIPKAKPSYGAKVVKLFNTMMTEVCETWGDRSPCIELWTGIGNARPDRLRALMYEICKGAGGSPAVVPASPSDGELATPTGTAPAPAQSAQVAQPAQPASNTSSPAPQNGDTAQQSESCSWSGGGSESSNKDPPSGGAPQPAQASSNQTGQGESVDAANDCSSFLSNLIKHIDFHCDDDTICAMLCCLVSLVDEIINPLPTYNITSIPDKASPSERERLTVPAALPLLLREMARLADSEGGAGHKILFPAAVEWLNTAVLILSHENTLEQVEWSYSGTPKGAFTALAALLESACVLLTYLTDAMQAVATTASVTHPQTTQVYRSISPSWETPADFSAELDWLDETQDEDDTSADDSDEDSMLNMRLCTFTVTAREFMNQHWYHCHSCNMVDGVGVCSVCARVCHRGHDVTYAKFGNFFCDCGAKEDSSCQALVKRSSSHTQTLGRGAAAGAVSASAGAVTATPADADTPTAGGSTPAPSLRRRASSPSPSALQQPSRRPPTVAIRLEGVRPLLNSFEGWSHCVERIAHLAKSLVPSLSEACALRSPVGCLKRARTALSCLHNHNDRKYVLSDTLMVPTLGSQEGAFENVRMSYTGEQGQTIRQLIGAHMIRRVAMCCLASPLGRRQHLAVSHEKGKITVLQLSALLKQADSPKHKLTLTRLSSAPIPFTVLTLSGNAWNEDLLAVCGLKECHILTFNSGGSVAEHIALQPGLDTGNFIIRAIWLPGTQTQLALITADFVKIYDLSKDTISPQYHFLVPSGKVRDVTFVYQEEVMHMLCMSSAGHIYWQPMSEESRASHGPFYVTNTLEVVHSENKDVGGQVGGGGVSIYYSHIMKMLFFSYAHGKSFMAPLTTIEDTLKGVSLITLSGSSVQKDSTGGNSGGRGGGKGGAHSLCQWQEVPGHPGLITAVLQASNNPVVLMLRPFQIGVQEIKVVPAKAKITDMVAVRHGTSQHSGSDHKTTLILLCEDGSLRIYAANPENTGFWLSSAVQPVWKMSGSSTSGTSGAAGARGRRGTKAITNQASAKGKTPQSAVKSGTNTGVSQFPIDFFEHCLVLSEVEYGGNDLLQVYNTGQVKHRLNTTGLYVASTKLSGFSMDITNSDVSTVITGIRVLLGTQDTNRAPTYIEIFGRTIPTVLQQQRSRWFDIPLMREESLQIDKRLAVTFGPSQDAEGVVMVDSVKVYGRTKEAFGWPDENDEGLGASGKPGSASAAASGVNGTGGTANDEAGPAALERLACSALEALELGVSDDLAAICGSSAARESALNAAERVLCAPCTPQLHTRAKHLLHSVHGPSNYHHHKDQAIMGHVLETLQELSAMENSRDIDPENFFRCALLARSVAVERPANLVKFGGATPNPPADDEWSSLWLSPSGPIPAHVVCLLAGVTWKLAHVRGPWPEGAGAAGPLPIVSYGLRHVEHTLHALVDVVHAYQMHSPDSQMANIGNSIYCQLLLAKDQIISFGAKTAIMRVLRPKVKRRRVYIPSPPTTPGGTGGLSIISVGNAPVAQVDELPPPDHNDNHDHFVEVDHPLEPMILLAQEGGLEALLDIPPDADDETMVELAIALSLQEGAVAVSGAAGRAPGGEVGAVRAAAAGAAAVALRGAAQRRLQPPQAPPPPPQDSSPPGSDDEGSTAATDGSTLRTSPAEAPGSGGSAGSDSGGSGAESIGGVSGRSSAYGEMVSAPSTAAVAAAAASVDGSEPAATIDTDPEMPRDADISPVEAANDAKRVRTLRVALLQTALSSLPHLHTLPGVRAVPFMQVILMLAGDLDISLEQDRIALERLLEDLVAELEMCAADDGPSSTTPIYERTNRRELQLVITRLLSVLMARWKPTATSAPTTSSAPSPAPPPSARLSRMTAVALAKGGAVPHCAKALESLLTHWRAQPAANIGSSAPTSSAAPVAASAPVAAVPAALGEQLLKPHPPHPLPDMQPFFVKQYVKSTVVTVLPSDSDRITSENNAVDIKCHPWDVFENYPHLLTEMALRLPYQIHKLLDPPQIVQYFDKSWNTLLCEYMMNQQTPFLRKQVRKLLMLLCGGRERYRQLRDTHALDVHLSEARKLCMPAKPQPWSAKNNDEPAIGTDLPYDCLVKLMDHLKASAEMVVARTGNWQHMCASQSPTYLSWLLRAACILGDGVAAALLQLVQCALCAPTPATVTAAVPAIAAPPNSQTPKERSDRERSADSDSSATDGSRFQEALVPPLVRQIWEQLSQDELRTFIRVFLLETNSTAVRWQAHSLLLAIYNNCTDAERSTLLGLLWQVWPSVPQYGRKAGQFVDLLGYFSLKTPNINTEDYLASAVELLHTQNNLLAGHGNAPLYAALANYVELDGHYLESEPCLVCNNPEVPMGTIKLSTIKIDSKFTTTTQIVKLIGSHTISRISLRISDLKRSKMVRAMNFFYNNRTVQAVQELKNKPGMWHKAKRVYLQSGQSEVRVDFPLPIVACNLMMEYADFYENQQATGESLQCPRCSASVPANPGVCANCGENVFQCHKCRAINYDEKDPFLCHACGFCKYAKFDYTLTARQCCAVDTIENDDDRKKMVATIGTLLDKADRVYRQLVANKPLLESLIHKISEQRVEGRGGGLDEQPIGPIAGGGGSAAQVNRGIQTLAHKYCVESRGHFDDLSKIIQKVLACRKELVLYDRSQSEQLQGDIPPAYTALLHGSVADPGKSTADASTGCYGCALAAAEYCLTLLRALASAPKHRERLCQLGLVKELVHHNLRRGSPQCQEEVRQLICLITKDNLPATEGLCNLLSQRITLSLMGHAATQDHSNSVRPLVVLLGALVKMEDAVECWEARLRCIVRLWMWCCPQLAEAAGVTPNQVTLALLENNAGTLSVISGAGSTTSNAAQHHALQQVALPCLRFMQELMAPLAATPTPNSSATAVGTSQPAVVSAPITVEKAKESSAEKTPPPTSEPAPSLSSVAAETAVLDLGAWLSGRVPYADWRCLAPPAVSPGPPSQPTPVLEPAIPEEMEATVVAAVRDRMPVWAGPLSVHDRYLAEKYACKWKRKVMFSHGMRPLNLASGSWLRPVIFDASSKRARDTACQLTKELCHGYERTKAVIILLTSFLPQVGAAGEASEQFLQLYQSLISEAPWKQFLALRGVLQQLADLMTKEIEHLHRLEETTLTSDLSQGYALKRLTELLALLLEEPGTRRAYKGRLVGAVLGGYLSLRRLVVQRTRLTDDTQEKLLELLEEMTTGTETETAEFMAVCIETVQKYPLHDYRTPVFIFERLCSIIYPEENDVGEFFLTLEKDPQQEDFLQGRMLGNPYSSVEPGLGPLMRDVKNKICADCELVALLEDDNGMELLVCNKIMSLDLPVKDVFKKVWCAGGEGGDAMRVVYRMRGLLGDATEEFVESLTGNTGGTGTDADGADDDETTYRLAGALADCGGLECMLSRLRGVRRVAAARALCAVLLRLASLCARVRRCLRVLTRGEVQAVPALLGALQLAVEDERDHVRPELTCQLLEIMERILSVAASESLESFLHFSLTFGGPEYVQALLSCTECPGIRTNPVALGHLTRVLAALVYGNDLKMALLCAHFKSVLDFNKFDGEHKAEDEFRLELFCVLCANIERNAIGGTLKDYLISLGIVRDALDYITIHAPCVKPTLLRTDSDELKEFISRSALKYILRFLTGLATEHEPTQMAVCEKVIPIVHRLEQVSSDEHVGSLAENLLEALRSHPDAAKRVQESRNYTRQEKKRLAMAMREKQLGALGMRTNDKGQVTAAQCSLVHQVQELGDETGLVCCICREGYKYQPTKVLGIYTFTKRCGVEEFEVRARKTLGYTTVSHFNVVHVECHMAAVRLARARDEWESAALQNASTRCNGLLPLWGPHVPESAFASCLARHNTYLQECTSHRDIGYQLTVHDVKLLLLRFARGKTFHDDTGGGGPLSNMQLVPALMHLALYVVNTTRTASREVGALTAAMEWGPVRRLESAHDAEGPLYHATMALLVHPPDKWRANKLELIRRMILVGHCRAISPKGPALRTLAQDQRTARPWAAYKPYMIFLSIIQMLYDVMFKHVTATTVEQWPTKLAEAIRHGDESCQRSAEKMVTTLTDELLPCTTLAEFCDAAGLLVELPEPDAFVEELLKDQP